MRSFVSGSARKFTRVNAVRERENADRRQIAMLIESTEQFQVSTAIAIRRGRNEVAEMDYECLPVATRRKLRILEEHGVLQVCPSSAESPSKAAK